MNDHEKKWMIFKRNWKNYSEKKSVYILNTIKYLSQHKSTICLGKQIK